jgi:hypothetical protein
MFDKYVINKMNFFLLVGHICIRDKDCQMSFKKMSIQTIWSHQVIICSMATSLSSILFYNVNNNFKGCILNLQKKLSFIPFCINILTNW